MTETPSASPVEMAAPVAPVSADPAIVSDAPSSADPVNPMEMSDDALAARYAVPKSEPEPEPITFAASEAEAAPVAEPPAATPAEAAPAPITPFAVFDAEGEVEVPAITVTFKAGGKEYEKVPLDRVVRMAQSAPLAERYRVDAERVPVLEGQMQEVQQHYTKANEIIAANNALYERMLADPDVYIKAVEAYAQQSSPEARAQRAEQEAAQLRQQQQQYATQQQTQTVIAQASAFTSERIAPAVSALVEKYASVIEPEEFTDRFHTLTADLMRIGPNGTPWVPPQQLAEVERRVQTDLTAWAEQRAQKRASSRTAVTQQATTQVQKAQADAQQAKRTLARATLPARTAVGADVPRTPPIKTAQDAMDASLRKVMQSVSGR